MDQIGFAQLVLNGEIKLSKKLLPSYLFTGHFWLGLEVAYGHVICTHHKLGSEEVMALGSKAVHNHCHLHLVNYIPLLGVIQLSIHIGH